MVKIPHFGVISEAKNVTPNTWGKLQNAARNHQQKAFSVQVFIFRVWREKHQMSLCNESQTRRLKLTNNADNDPQQVISRILRFEGRSGPFNSHVISIDAEAANSRCTMKTDVAFEVQTARKKKHG